MICQSIDCDQFRENAALAVRAVRDSHGFDLTYDAIGVQWVDDHINDLRGRMPFAMLHPYVEVFGSFLGESLIRTYGGDWVERDGEWGVQINEDVWAAPFTKTFKHFANGPKDSIANLFSVFVYCM